MLYNYLVALYMNFYFGKFFVDSAYAEQFDILRPNLLTKCVVAIFNIVVTLMHLRIHILSPCTCESKPAVGYGRGQYICRAAK